MQSCTKVEGQLKYVAFRGNTKERCFFRDIFHSRLWGKTQPNTKSDKQHCTTLPTLFSLSSFPWMEYNVLCSASSLCITKVISDQVSERHGPTSHHNGFSSASVDSEAVTLKIKASQREGFNQSAGLRGNASLAIEKCHKPVKRLLLADRTAEDFQQEIIFTMAPESWQCSPLFAVSCKNARL